MKLVRSNQVVVSHLQLITQLASLEKSSGICCLSAEHTPEEEASFREGKFTLVLDSGQTFPILIRSVSEFPDATAYFQTKSRMPVLAANTSH